MDPSGAQTQHASAPGVITPHDPSNEAPLLIRRFQGQGCVRVHECALLKNSAAESP